MKLSIALAGVLLFTGAAGALAENRITADIQSVDVIHNGKIVHITRAEEDKGIPLGYEKASRNCPPFCIQPMQVLPGVETIGELEVLGYLKRRSEGDDSVLVVDSRTPDWVARGTIPGAVNIPWTKINTEVGGTFALETEAATLDGIMQERFGVTRGEDGQWDFSNAKTLVLFCNGIWCGQSSQNMRTLAKLGYPTQKMKWYRGGMQDWVSVGLTTVKP